MKIFNLTVNAVLSLIDERNKGAFVHDLTNKYNVSRATIISLYKAYNGNLKYYNKLGVESKKIIDECIRLKNKRIANTQKYQVKMLFGLITLKVNPVID